MSDNLIEESKKGNTEEELKNISDFLYKNELLYALNIPDFNEELVNRKITALIDEIDKKLEKSKYKNIFGECIDKIKEKYGINDALTYVFLFSYDYFHITHLCFIDLFKKDDFYEENIMALKSIIMNE